MANFIKKIVDRARSRSKSPVKYQKNDYELWKHMKQQQQHSSRYGSSMEAVNYFMHSKYEPQLHIHVSIFILPKAKVNKLKSIKALIRFSDNK